MDAESRTINNPLELRMALLDFIADFANWDNSSDVRYLNTARALTQSAHEALGGKPGTRPLVVDPFAGGGSIPLEALRVGADAYASDLNPVAVLLNKVVLEYIPKYGQTLADEVRKWGKWVKAEAEKELAEYYPKDPDGATPIAYLWARTITCEGPGCGAEVPLIRGLSLAKRPNRSIALKLIPKPAEKCVDFELIHDAKPANVKEGTVKRGSATCPCCGYTTPVASVRKQLKPRRGGADDARMFCVVTTKPTEQGRFYRLPTQRDLDAVKRAKEELERRKREWTGELSLVPDEPYPDETGAGAISSSVLYGFTNWGDLFTSRQLLSLTTLVRITKQIKTEKKVIESDHFLKSILLCLAITVNRQVDKTSTLCRWDSTRENPQGAFGRQALPMIWDFNEVYPFSGSGGDYETALNWVINVLNNQNFDHNLEKINTAIVIKNSATNLPLNPDTVDAIVTDPPYYDAIAYGDLSDFFYVWLKRSIGEFYPELFNSILVNKTEEVVQLSKRFKGPYSHKTKEYFENGMFNAMNESKRVLIPSGIGVVVFAHKTTAGWEAQLQSLINSGWIISASWPIDTELGNRMNAMGTASLASSIHLVCRPRENPDGSVRTDDVGDWRDVLHELPIRIHEWMPRLADEGVVGADAIFACLGPALEIYSRYSRVEKPNGEQVLLREYLEKVWEAVAREALTVIFHDADTSGFEEDARLTAMWLWTINGGEQNGAPSSAPDDEETGDDEEKSAGKKAGVKGGFILEYDAARKIAQGLGAHPEDMRTLVEVKGDTARLLPVSERAAFLFGKEGTKMPVTAKKRGKQLTLGDATITASAETPDLPYGSGSFGEIPIGSDGVDIPRAKTVLDSIHQSMLLFGAGRSDALKTFLVDNGAGNDPRFWRLAQALSALYPKTSEEKRWVDGVLARKKGLGL